MWRKESFFSIIFNNIFPIYISKNSKQPPNVFKPIPISLYKRILRDTGNIKIFDEKKKSYGAALRNRAYLKQVKYTNENKPSIDNRKSNIIWFNQSCNNTLKTKIGNIFLKNK